MSLSQHAAHLRNGTKMGGLEFVDTMLKDGLWDAFHGYHMGNTAENVATKYQITREQQDEFALASQQKASAAQKSGRFKDEIVPVTVKSRKGDTVVSDDEYIRHDASAGDDGAAAAGLHQGRHGDRRQRLGHQRRRRGAGADDRGRGGQARPDAAGAHRRVRHRRRRSGGDGHRADPVDAQGAGPRRLEGRTTST